MEKEARGDVVCSFAMVEMTLICTFLQLKPTPVNQVDIRTSTQLTPSNSPEIKCFLAIIRRNCQLS
jgi:hypothetical protein